MRKRRRAGTTGSGTASAGTRSGDPRDRAGGSPGWLGTGERTADSQGHGRGQQSPPTETPGLPAPGARADLHRSGSPQTSRRGSQAEEGRVPSRPLSGTPEGERRTPRQQGQVGWTGEKGRRLEYLCGTGAKGGQEEKGRQRLFSGVPGGRAGRPPGQERGRRGERTDSRGSGSRAGGSPSPGVRPEDADTPQSPPIEKHTPRRSLQPALGAPTQP